MRRETVRARAEEAVERFEIEETAAEGMIVGEVEVEGRLEDPSEKFARPDGSRRNGATPAWSRSSPAIGASWSSSRRARPPAQRVPHRPASATAGSCSPPTGSRTRIEYAIDVPSGRVLIAFGWLFITLGLAALSAGCWIMLAYVIPSPNLSVRGQALQMVQVAHFLWPPFLETTRLRAAGEDDPGPRRWRSYTTCRTPERALEIGSR